MKLFKYFRWSNIKISLDLSPFTWSFKWIYDRENPDIKAMIYCRLLPLSILLILDDGVISDDALEVRSW